MWLGLSVISVYQSFEAAVLALERHRIKIYDRAHKAPKKEVYESIYAGKI